MWFCSDDDSYETTVRSPGFDVPHKGGYGYMAEAIYIKIQNISFKQRFAL